MQKILKNIIKKLEELKEIEKNKPNKNGIEDGEQIYNNGRSQGKYEQTVKIIDIITKEAERYDIFVNNEYCWQSCWCTEKCQECRRLGNGEIDYYENY